MLTSESSPTSISGSVNGCGHEGDGENDIEEEVDDIYRVILVVGCCKAIDR